ncbi:MAG: class II aldolase/adducin family protein [Thermodesulfobacteriota bacterium]|nr:class II aldolase/adducin family protein [Thermodesulfobacteriota bacterium]
MENIRREVRLTSLEVLKKGLVQATAGNCSARVTNHNIIAITPNGMDYNDLKDEDIVLTDFSGTVFDGEREPSIELPMHLAIYKCREDVSAIIHTHSVFASTMAVAGKQIPLVIDELMVYVGGEIELAQYALPGSGQLAENALKALSERNAVLLQNHGMVGVGRDSKSALFCCEIVEKAAMITVFASLLGKVETIPSDALEVEKTWFEKNKENTKKHTNQEGGKRC